LRPDGPEETKSRNPYAIIAAWDPASAVGGHAENRNPLHAL
jgi:hypothetical protein